jgi:hypothetical protein
VQQLTEKQIRELENKIVDGTVPRCPLCASKITVGKKQEGASGATGIQYHCANPNCTLPPGHAYKPWHSMLIRAIQKRAFQLMITAIGSITIGGILGVATGVIHWKWNAQSTQATGDKVANPPLALPGAKEELRPRVVLVDTRDPAHMYDPKKITSNVKLLLDQIKVSATDLDAESKEVNGVVPQASEILQVKPNLVVIHRSAFDFKGDKTGAGEQRLVSFLGGLRNTNALFLIYSRTKDTDGKYAEAVANETALKNRVFTYQFRYGNPFKDQAVVEHFVRTIDIIAHSKTAGSH